MSSSTGGSGNQQDTQAIGIFSNTRSVARDDGFREIHYPDGSVKVYGNVISMAASRRLFLTEVNDPQGNKIILQYDSTPAHEGRLLRIIDALGQQTTLSYEEPGSPFLVTKVTDPFGRFARFHYETAANGDKCLKRITDAIGIEPSFEYNDKGEIVALTTPYGTTTFDFQSPMNTAGLWAWIEATDPHGDKERIENYFTDARNGQKPIRTLRRSGGSFHL